MRAPSPTFSRLLSVSAAVFCLMVARPAHAQEEQADGLFVTVQNPITEGGIAQIKATIDRARTAPKRNIKTVVFDFNPEGKEAATENYGPCSDLADYIRSLAARAIGRQPPLASSTQSCWPAGPAVT